MRIFAAQVADWKKDHKVMCSQLRDMRAGHAKGGGGGRQPLDRQGVVARVLGRVRLYLCPFAVCHGEAQGRGFVFVQVRVARSFLATVESALVDLATSKLMGRTPIEHLPFISACTVCKGVSCIIGHGTLPNNSGLTFIRFYLLFHAAGAAFSEHFFMWHSLRNRNYWVDVRVDA